MSISNKIIYLDDTNCDITENHVKSNKRSELLILKYIKFSLELIKSNFQS